MRLPKLEQDLLSNIAYPRGWKKQEIENAVIYNYDSKIPYDSEDPDMFISIVVAIEGRKKINV